MGNNRSSGRGLVDFNRDAKVRIMAKKRRYGRATLGLVKKKSRRLVKLDGRGVRELFPHGRPFME